jgi:hypothetical protein
MQYGVILQGVVCKGERFLHRPAVLQDTQHRHEARAHLHIITDHQVDPPTDHQVDPPVQYQGAIHPVHPVHPVHLIVVVLLPQVVLQDHHLQDPPEAGDSDNNYIIAKREIFFNRNLSLI